MDDLNSQRLLDLVGHIYETAADSQHWQEFVSLLERIYPHSRVTLFEHDKTRPGQTLKVSENYDPADVRAYVEHHVKTSPYLARVDRVPVGLPSQSEMMIGDEELKKTEYYNEYVRPRRLGHYATGIVLERRPGRTVALAVADHRNDGDRRAHQLKLIGMLAPHLMRAYRLHRAFATQKATNEATQAAFDRWTHAALILTTDGSVVSINHAAEVLLRKSDGLQLGRNGELRCIDEARTRALDIAIRKCAAIATSMNTDTRRSDLDGVVLPRPSGAAPLRAMMWPLPFLGDTTAPDFGRATVLLVIFNPDHVQRTPVGWLAHQFGLTPSEQRLTEAIVNGVPLTEAAEQLGIRVSTARTRLKTIQAKTDCHRQVDLVRLALSLPTVWQEDSLLEGFASKPARSENKNQHNTDDKRTSDDGKHRERTGTLEHRQQCERDQSGGDAIHRPGAGADNSPKTGRKALSRIDVKRHDVDCPDKLKRNAGRHQRKRRRTDRKRQTKQRH
jgi:DNA-binding CsgD family transcriptional regulator